MGVKNTAVCVITGCFSNTYRYDLTDYRSEGVSRKSFSCPETLNVEFRAAILKIVPQWPLIGGGSWVELDGW